jgi:hypothetical protein
LLLGLLSALTKRGCATTTKKTSSRLGLSVIIAKEAPASSKCASCVLLGILAKKAPSLLRLGGVSKEATLLLLSILCKN